MKKSICCIFLFFSWTITFGQATDSILLKINGRIIDDTFKTAIKYPHIEIYTTNGQVFEVNGDSLGFYYFEKVISKKSDKIMLSVNAKKYSTKHEKILIDSSNFT